MVNRIGEAEQERLGLFTEEMGEAQLEIGKILRHGIDSHHPDDPSLSNAQRLELEAGHVLAAIDLLVEAGTLNLGVLAHNRKRKLQKLRSWLHCGTNLDAVEALLGRYADPEAPELGVMRDMLADARAEFRRQAEPLLLDDVGKDAELRTFFKSVEAAIGECSTEQALDALRRRKAERNQALAKAHACGGCDAPNIGVAEDGTQYCCHCGWNDPNKDLAFACGKCGGRWAFAPSTLLDGWPPVDSGCCGSGAWTKP